MCEKAGSTEYEGGEKIVGQEFFALFREYNLQRLESMHEDSTEGEEVKREKSFMKGMTKKEKINRQDGR